MRLLKQSFAFDMEFGELTRGERTRFDCIWTVLYLSELSHELCLLTVPLIPDSQWRCHLMLIDVQLFRYYNISYITVCSSVGVKSPSGRLHTPIPKYWSKSNFWPTVTGMRSPKFLERFRLRVLKKSGHRLQTLTPGSKKPDYDSESDSRPKVGLWLPTPGLRGV